MSDTKDKSEFPVDPHRPDTQQLGMARAMPDASRFIEIIGGGSLGSVIADCVWRMGFRALVIDHDTWEVRNMANSLAKPGEPKGDFQGKVQAYWEDQSNNGFPKEPLIRVLATDNLASRIYAMNEMNATLAGIVDVRTGPMQATVAIIPSVASVELVDEIMGYDLQEHAVPDMGCGDRGSMPQTLMATAPACWAIMQMLRAYAECRMQDMQFGRRDLILTEDGWSLNNFIPFAMKKPVVTLNGEPFDAAEWRRMGAHLFHAADLDNVETKGETVKIMIKHLAKGEPMAFASGRVYASIQREGQEALLPSAESVRDLACMVSMGADQLHYTVEETK